MPEIGFSVQNSENEKLERCFLIKMRISHRNTYLAELLGLADNERAIVYIQPTAAIVSGVTVSFAALGEEAGSRSDNIVSFLICMLPMMVIGVFMLIEWQISGLQIK